VRVFLNGIGPAVPPSVTGAINPNPGVPLNLPVTVTNGAPATVAAAVSAPGLISGIWQVDMIVPNARGAIPISLSVDSVPVRDANLTIWVR
jgi:hypothetical protein